MAAKAPLTEGAGPVCAACLRPSVTARSARSLLSAPGLFSHLALASLCSHVVLSCQTSCPFSLSEQPAEGSATWVCIVCQPRLRFSADEEVLLAADFIPVEILAYRGLLTASGQRSMFHRHSNCSDASLFEATSACQCEALVSSLLVCICCNSFFNLSLHIECRLITEY